MKKVLKCRLKDYYEVTSKLEPWATGKKYPIEQLHVNDIWASVPVAIKHQGIEFYEPIKASILKNGMHYPIMVVKATRREILDQKAIWGDKILDPPFWMAEDMNVIQPVVWGGSNRLYIARELGYTHIDCAIMPSFNEAHRLQKTMREPFAQHYPMG